MEISFDEDPNSSSSSSRGPSVDARVTISQSLHALGMNQDLLFSFVQQRGGGGGKTYVLACFDGHGPNLAIDQLRNENLIDFKDIMSRFPDDPELHIQERMNAINDCELRRLYAARRFNEYALMTRRMKRSGTTSSIVCVDIFPRDGNESGNDGYGTGEITCRHCGDSTIMVIKNGEIVYVSKDHTLANADERERLTGKGRTKPGWKHVLLSDAKVTMMKNDSFVFDGDGDGEVGNGGDGGVSLVLVPTQSLGHCGKTGIFPTVTKIPFSTLDDSVRVIVGSDGLWDMIMLPVRGDEENRGRRKNAGDDDFDLAVLLNGTCEEITEVARTRWNQEWDYARNKDDLESTVKDTFDEKDDVSCIVFDFN